MKRIILPFVMLICAGCASFRPPMPTAQRVDLHRYQGKWYVIACIPTFIEKKAYNETEEYYLLSNGSIDTVLTFNQGDYNGPLKRYNPKGSVLDHINNSSWAMQFIWPFTAEYLITYLNGNYTETIVGRHKRDYVWIMARTPVIPNSDYQQLIEEIVRQGYNITKLRKVPLRDPRL